MMRFLVALVVVSVVGAAVAASVLWERLDEPYKNYVAGELFVEIPPGTSVADIGGRLVAAGVVRDALTFRAALWRSGRGQRLQAGEYRFAEALAPADVIDRLARGDVYTRRITFPEGLTIAQMAAAYESQGFGLAGEFQRAAAAVGAIADLDPEAHDLEGYLFPETYSLPRRASAEALVGMMVGRFKATFTDDLRARARANGLTLRQAVTLASVVEKETGAEAERPLVAAVYRNRLRIRMPMQADPTLIYALQKARRYDGNIRKADLLFESRYNTYLYPGLPPGPIASPGRASLVAALSPADVPYLYFVSRNDKTHVFAETLAKHNENVRRYQVQYFRERREATVTATGGRGKGVGGRAASGDRR